MTEKDNDSLHHAREVLATNRIGPEAISILEVPQPGGILFPLLDDPNLKVDMTMCNPPFYASDEEMQKGVDLKLEGPHAVRPALLSRSKLMIGC
jgi:methyltransferase